MSRRSDLRFVDEGHAPMLDSMIAKKPAPDLIRGDPRFSDKIVRQE
jgi:hypothetical protein